MEYNGFKIVGDGTFGMKEVKMNGRGALPKLLRGSFSTPREAMKAIDGVIAKKGGEKDGKAESTS